MSALLSGYMLYGTYILTQIFLTPLYLRVLGDEQFGILMIFLNIITFAVFGITWFSGGLIRVLGEYWSGKKINKFNETLLLGKYIFTGYSVIVSIFALFLFFCFRLLGQLSNIEVSTIIFISIYFILTYEALPERQAFMGANWQALGNSIELTKIIVFATITYYLLPYYKNIDFIFFALIIGVVTQRILTGLYLRIKLKFSGWGKIRKSMKPDFSRFLGKQGIYYFTFSTIVLLLQLDVVIIGILAGPTIAGKFVLLWKIPEVLGLLLGKIPSSLEPKIIHLDAQSEMNRFKTLFLRGKILFIIICFLVSILYMYFGLYITSLWVGERAPSESWMYFVAGLALFFFSISRWPISFAFAQIKLEQLVRLSMIEFISKLLFTLVLFKYFSYTSPLIAMIIIHVVYLARGYQKIA